jgi:hypothetical protein
MTHRFHFINTEYVKKLWKTEAGREELKLKEELSSYCHLTLVPKEDIVLFIARFLDPNLNLWLQETMTLPRLQIQDMDLKKWELTLEPLVYRLINRLPIDVYVTSINGFYISLSAGVNQGLRVGQKLEIVRSYIKTIHPIHGGWAGYQTEILGTAEIFDVQDESSVAKLIKENFHSAVSIGDGAINSNIFNRQFFLN